jgi:hypothetical protein
MERPDPRSLLTTLKTIKLYLNDPRQALKIEKREWGIWLARRELQRRGLAQLYTATPAQVYWPDWPDLLNIYELVRRRKPKVVIEFGSGCSTLMFARALADMKAAGEGEGHLYSIETSEHFKAYTESYFPVELKPFVDIIHSGIEFGEMGGKSVLWHKTIPDVVPNLVYLDGPDYQDFSSNVETQADGVLLEAKAPDDYAILVDLRWKTFEFTRANLKHHYKVTVNSVDSWELFEREPET